MFTLDQVIALAPDAASIKAGRTLASSRKWTNIGMNEEAMWGLAPSSGKNPYFTQIHLTEPAFKCSCPSRKFPCKHALALMFMSVNDTSIFTETTQPDWVTEWHTARSSRAEKIAIKEQSAPDLKAAQKRKDKKLSRINEGVEILEQFLKDTIRNGLTSSQLNQPSIWQNLSKRMLDSQARGLSSLVKDLEPDTLQPNWETRFIHSCGSIFLLLQSWKKRDNLTPEFQAEIEQLIGITPLKEDVLAGKTTETIDDNWQIISKKHAVLDNISVCQIWLLGETSNRWAKKLNFSPLPKKADIAWTIGSCIKTKLSFYPGITNTRALAVNEQVACSTTNLPPSEDNSTLFSEFLNYYASLKALNPWHKYQPFIVKVTLNNSSKQPLLVDSAGHALPVILSLQQQQFLKSTTGDHPSLTCCDWNGYELNILSIEAENTWVNFI